MRYIKTRHFRKKLRKEQSEQGLGINFVPFHLLYVT